MNIEKTWLTCREASKLLNCTQRHIINLIKKGKLSASKNIDGNWEIEKSEFFRAYPAAMNKETPGSDKKSSENNLMETLEEKVRHLEEMVSVERKHIEYLKDQLGNFTVEKSKMLDAINSHARLLEYKESEGKSGKPSSKKGWWPFKRG